MPAGCKAGNAGVLAVKRGFLFQCGVHVLKCGACSFQKKLPSITGTSEDQRHRLYQAAAGGAVVMLLASHHEQFRSICAGNMA